MEKDGLSFVRDLIIKIFIVLLFIFLLTLIFPTPNLTPLYNRIFNDNIQNMKDAAENYFTKERMPEKEGDTSKLTLKQMLDQKLVLPFLDKNGKECDLNKSYVEVTKKKNEYELKVYLKCGDETNYIIEPIGCYNFCPDNSCTKDVTTSEDGQVTIIPNKDVPTGDNNTYKLQYLYTKTDTSTNWVTGDWTTQWQNETDIVKLLETKEEYTGKKKVDAGTTTYVHKKDVYEDNWTYDKDWTNEVKQITDNVKLYDTRTLYTGQKKYIVETAKYRHIKDVYEDNWTEGTWTNEEKTETDLVKLVDTRTLYTGQLKYTEDQVKYVHVKYDTRDNWKETGYQETKYNTNKNVVLLGTRYTLERTIVTTSGTWSNWVKDTTWRTSKPSNSSTKQWSDPYAERTVTSKGKLVQDDFVSSGKVVDSDKYIYEKYKRVDESCGNDCCDDCCDSSTELWYYRVYEKAVTKEYKYMYRTYSSKGSETTETKVVYDDPTKYKSDGWYVIKYEYNYNINTPEKYEVDRIETDSITPPTGYEYANEKKVHKIEKTKDLGKWVTSKEALGEYTYNIVTKKQYKYKYNNPTVKTEEIWTDSKTSPAGYVYANEKIITRTTKSEDLGKWVTSMQALGEYTYNIVTKKQYKYKYNNPTGNTVYIETDSIIPPEGYTYTGTYHTTSKISYIDLGRWVSSKSELGEYTYDVQMRKLYKYKTKVTNTSTVSQWFDNNPGGSWVYTGITRRVAVPLYK